MLKPLRSYDLSAAPPQCLLLGNGINRAFADSSWEDIIREELRLTDSSRTYEDIVNMPSTMQIVVATNDNVDKSMSRLADRLLKINMDDQRKAFLQCFLSLPVDDIFTANYSFELEAADGMPMSKLNYSHALRRTRELKGKETDFRLFHYYQTAAGKRIWHIHGDIAKPSTMLMGHYYYAKHLRAIQDCVAGTVRKAAQAEKRGMAFHPDNWVDLFLTGDVYIVGFGMYLCESDLWYLLCCKKRHFPNARTFLYDLTHTDRHKQYMLDAYKVSTISGQDLSVTSFPCLYSSALLDIQSKVASRRDNR